MEEDNRKQSDKGFYEDRYDDYEFCIFCGQIGIE